MACQIQQRCNENFRPFVVSRAIGITTWDRCMLDLVPNTPLDFTKLANLLSDREELYLVWPEATFPFDGEQWREKLLSRPGNRSYFVSHNGEVIGHAALLETDEPHVLAVSYLFIRADQRGRGFGKELISLVECEARKTRTPGH